MREQQTSAAFLSDADTAPAIFPLRKETAIIAASVIDCIAAAVYFVVTLGLVLLARRRAEDADTHTVTIHDYSVYVRSLTQDATAGELVDFFGQWREVRALFLHAQLHMPCVHPGHERSLLCQVEQDWWH